MSRRFCVRALDVNEYVPPRSDVPWDYERGKVSIGRVHILVDPETFGVRHRHLAHATNLSW